MILNQDFYPTPDTVARKMVQSLKLHHQGRNRYVLDPSAGSGSLLEAVIPPARTEYENRQRYVHLKCYAVEADPELRSVLEGKGFPVVGFDFLSYVPRLQFTDIIMNPPFRSAWYHVRQAWDILVAGEIASLYPATALEGRTAEQRLILELVKAHGSIEPLGPIFKNADRPTDAEIVLIRLTKKPSDTEGLDFDIHNTVKLDSEWTENDPSDVAPGGFIAGLLAFSDAAIAAYADYNRARQELLKFTSPFEQRNFEPTKILDTADKQTTPAQRYNTFVEGITAAGWNAIIDHPRFKSVLTERARNAMDTFRQSQKRVDFNEENVRAMFAALMQRQEEFLDGAVQDAFDTMTKYHSENRVHVEGWKSDLAWMAARKVVLPYYIQYDGHFSLDYRKDRELDDIDRAMCVVTEKRFDSIQKISGSLRDAFQNKHQKWCTSEFFDIKYFMKGTIHLTFKDKLEWEQFNIAAAKGRKWIKPGKDAFK